MFAHLGLFDKILLISCFRPDDQILSLLKTWLNTNFPYFYSFLAQTYTFLSNHYKKEPIILIFDEGVLPLGKNNYLLDLYQKVSTLEKTPIYISMMKSNI